jgi:hypothetical protein
VALHLSETEVAAFTIGIATMEALARATRALETI